MQGDVPFSKVLHDTTLFYACTLRQYQSVYGLNAVLFTHDPVAERIQMGVTIPSIYNLTVYLTIEHISNRWFINNTHTDMNHLNLHYYFRRVHAGTVTALAFLHSRCSPNNWRISYNEGNTIHILGGGTDCYISISQNAITDMTVSGMFQSRSHQTGFMSLEDLKAILDTTSCPMDTAAIDNSSCSFQSTPIYVGYPTQTRW